jgi:hypothetical protein
MSLLDTASLIVTPNAYAESKLYSVIPSDGSGDMSVVRATTATRVNSAGLVELVPYNLVQYSEQFDNAAWDKANATITANSVASPSGIQDADTLTTTSTTVENYTRFGTFSILGNVGSSYTTSVYAKKGSGTFLRIRNLFVNNGGSDGNAWFDLTNGSVGTIQSSQTATIEDAGNGWWRCSLTGVVGSSNNFNFIDFGFTNTDGTNFPSTSINGYLWGAQLVEGTTALPYQKTETRLNIPRLDYSNGTCPSLLVEPQRTNLALYSSSFDNAFWNKFNGLTVTANNAVSPDGTQNADTLNVSNNSNILYGVLTGTFIGNTYTFSLYAKGSGNFTMNIRLNSSTTTSETKTLTSQWQRFTVTVTNAVPVIAIEFYLDLNTSSTYNIWGAQLEAGSYATSYIPTTSASVTRNADVISKTGISSLIGQTEGTMFVDAYVTIKNEDANPVVGLITINNNVNNINNCIIVGIDRPTSGVNNKVYTLVQLGGATVAEIFTPTITSGRYKIAFAYKQNDFALYVNGVLIGTDTSGNVPTCTQVLLGERFNSDPYKLADNINAAALWQTRLDNATLAQLTTI